MIEALKIEEEKSQDALKSRLELLKNEIESIKEKIETELINRESILNKYRELEHIKKKMTFNSNILIFTKGKTFPYFDDINTLEFKAKEKKVKLFFFNFSISLNVLFICSLFLIF